VADAADPAADGHDRAGGSAGLTPDATLLGADATEPGAEPDGLAITAALLMAGAAVR
jgi:hypothetical protein